MAGKVKGAVRTAPLRPHPTQSQPLEQRVWPKVDKSGGDDSCWLWTGGCDITHSRRGYLFYKNKNMWADKVVWALENGYDIDTPFRIRRMCHEPRCVNPKHHVAHVYGAGSASTSAERRFWSYVHKSDGCWEWQGAKNLQGYGQFSPTFGHNLGAHRYSYQICYGDIPDGLSVMHTCDNRACVNPKHLVLGTHQDNMRDMTQKGRASRHYRTVGLTREDFGLVASLHSDYGWTLKRIADFLGASPGYVAYMCREGKTEGEARDDKREIYWSELGARGCRAGKVEGYEVPTTTLIGCP